MQKLHYRPASEGSGRSPKICNSSVDESVYIKMIRQERPLWDKKHRDYKNLEVKNKIWKEIAEKCGSTGNECNLCILCDMCAGCFFSLVSFSLSVCVWFFFCILKCKIIIMTR